MAFNGRTRARHTISSVDARGALVSPENSNLLDRIMGAHGKAAHATLHERATQDSCAEITVDNVGPFMSFSTPSFTAS